MRMVRITSKHATHNTSALSIYTFCLDTVRPLLGCDCKVLLSSDDVLALLRSDIARQYMQVVARPWSVFHSFNWNTP